MYNIYSQVFFALYLVSFSLDLFAACLSPHPMSIQNTCPLD